MSTALPVAIVGAGPVGLAAAAHLKERNQPFVVLEAGPAVADNMRRWGHVRIFSPWRYVIDSAADRLLSAQGWISPDPELLPTGHNIIDDYLHPLADVLAPNIRTNARVVSIARVGLDKTVTGDRAERPFVVMIDTPTGREQLLARAVIDASGTYSTPNPIGANGYPAFGEEANADAIYYGIPDILGADRARYADQRVAVVGSGHSAFNALLDLVKLQEQHSHTLIVWILRRDSFGQIFGGGDNDELPARGALGQRLYAAVQSGGIQVQLGFSITEVQRGPDGIVLHSLTDSTPVVDQIIATTGLRPNIAMLRELRVELDPILEAPPTLAPLIDPNVHSCGTVPPHGAEQLGHPEPDFYIIGMKSYGRAPTFLMLTGYEQARSVAAALAGDWEAARRVDLTLPDSGVCCTDGADGGAPCCGTPAAKQSSFITLEAVGTIVGEKWPIEAERKPSVSAGCC